MRREESARAALSRAWSAFVGPEATTTDHLLTAATSVAGAVVAPRSARRRGASTGQALVACLLAVDLAGGVYVNNTRACCRWYERPGQGGREHLAFAALHVHPAAVAWLDRDVPRAARRTRAPGAVWAAAHYTYMMAATALVRRHPGHRRELGAVLTAGGLLLDGVLGPSARAPWFAWTYYPKLLLGHAGASLWSDAQLSGR